VPLSLPVGWLSSPGSFACAAGSRSVVWPDLLSGGPLGYGWRRGRAQLITSPTGRLTLVRISAGFERYLGFLVGRWACDC
jgi:hypothetical protein